MEQVADALQNELAQLLREGKRVEAEKLIEAKLSSSFDSFLRKSLLDVIEKSIKSEMGTTEKQSEVIAIRPSSNETSHPFLSNSIEKEKASMLFSSFLNNFFFGIKVIVVIAISLVALFGALALFPGGKEPTSAPKLASSPEPSLEALHVEVDDLFKAYEQNEVAQQAKMVGKEIWAYGVVTAVRLDNSGRAVVMFRTPNQFMPAPFTLLPSETASAGRITPRQVEVVVCKKVVRFLGTPTGSECKLWKKP